MVNVGQVNRKAKYLENMQITLVSVICQHPLHSPNLTWPRPHLWPWISKWDNMVIPVPTGNIELVVIAGVWPITPVQYTTSPTH